MSTWETRGHASRRVAAVAVAAAVATMLAQRARLRRVEVHGLSMEPTLSPGDRLVVVDSPRVRRGIRTGQLVAIADPRLPGRLLVKRVRAVWGAQHLLVEGDNADTSTDSRTFGPVERSALHGKVVYRYAPPQRVGWVE